MFNNFIKSYQYSFFLSDIEPILSATQETVEVSKTDSQFVEIGYISSVHGLQGEVRVKPNTDFPELRFSEVQFQNSLTSIVTLLESTLVFEMSYSCCYFLHLNLQSVVYVFSTLCVVFSQEGDG